MEATEPGSFNYYVSETFKLNGLEPVKFPTPRTTSSIVTACQEALSGMAETDDEQTDKEEDSTEKDMEIDDERIASEAGEIANLLKRVRTGSGTPPESTKKKKEDSKHKQKPPVPQKPQKSVKGTDDDADAAGAPAEAGATAAPSQLPREQRDQKPRSRTSSASSTTSYTSGQEARRGTKSLAMTVYVKKSSTLNITSRDNVSRNEIREAILRGDAKFTWRNIKVERDSILRALRKGTLDMNEMTYVRVADTQYEKIIDRCETVYGR